jgi:hypothetical protein
MKLHIFAGMALLLLALLAAAEPQELPRAKIEKMFGLYADTVGCDFSMDRKNIVKIDIEESGIMYL